MSFGFSVGDFLTTAYLIEKVVSALRETGGSASQYQRLTLELYTLRRAIHDVDLLQAAEGLEGMVDAIKATALSCQLPLNEFLASVRKYDKSLGLGETAGIMKDVLYKLQWVATKKLEAVMKLRSEITAYVGGIDLLLGLYQVKLWGLYEQRAQQRLKNLNTILSSVETQTQTITEDVKGVRYQVEESTKIVREDIKHSSKETSLALQNLKQSYKASLSRFLKTAGKFSEIALQTYTKVTETYNILVTVRSHLSEIDTRFTWFQDPIKFEDAYGREWLIPVEYNYLMMEGVLRGKFKTGRGKVLVERGQWQLFDSINTQNVITAKNWDPIPGMKITMAMIIPQTEETMICPRLNCSSKTYIDALGGGKICSICKAWFDKFLNVPGPVRFTEVDTSKDGHDSQANDYESVSSEIVIEGQLPAMDMGEIEVDFEIDENDLQYLKHARFRPTRHSEITVEQLVCLLSLTQKVYQKSTTMFGPRVKISVSLNSLSEALSQLLQKTEQHNSLLNSQKASALEAILSDCSQTLSALDTIIIRSKNHGTEKDNLLQQQVRLERREMVIINGLQRKVKSFAAAVNLFLNWDVMSHAEVKSSEDSSSTIDKISTLTNERKRLLQEASLLKAIEERQSAENKELKEENARLLEQRGREGQQLLELERRLQRWEDIRLREMSWREELQVRDMLRVDRYPGHGLKTL